MSKQKILFNEQELNIKIDRFLSRKKTSFKFLTQTKVNHKVNMGKPLDTAVL
jgi:hypothetical protein